MRRQLTVVVAQSSSRLRSTSRCPTRAPFQALCSRTRKFNSHHRASRFGRRGISTGPSIWDPAVDDSSETFFTDRPTIYALSTVPGRAGIAVIRISGPACQAIYSSLCPGKLPLKSRQATVRTLYEPGLTPTPNHILDKEALLISFLGPKTATGEEVLELHIHGGNATVKAVLAAISRCRSIGEDGFIRSIRYAEPGEFTRRAFENNRLDLAQVEALGDALSADTEMQRRAAIMGSSGDLSRQYESWRGQLLEARGELEAIIDFSEDQDFEDSNAELLKLIEMQVELMVRDIRSYEEGSRSAELIRQGIRISLLGPPNAGKSSLLNRIVGREASIVSTEAGTTRDVVEVSVDIEGYLCTFADTAGLRSQQPQKAAESVAGAKLLDHVAKSGRIGAIEEEGIRRAKDRARKSDFIIAFASVEQIDGQWDVKYDLETLQLASQAQKSVIVVNKIDLVQDRDVPGLLARFRNALSRDKVNYDTESIVAISCEPKADSSTGGLGTDPGNIKHLLNTLVGAFETMTAVQYDHMGVTERQRQLLESCRENCLKYLGEVVRAREDSKDFDVVVAAEHLRAAAISLARITGRGEGGDVEEVLGVVFEKFCVGK